MQSFVEKQTNRTLENMLLVRTRAGKVRSPILLQVENREDSQLCQFLKKINPLLTFTNSWWKTFLYLASTIRLLTKQDLALHWRITGDSTMVSPPSCLTSPSGEESYWYSLERQSDAIFCSTRGLSERLTACCILVMPSQKTRSQI